MIILSTPHLSNHPHTPLTTPIPKSGWVVTRQTPRIDAYAWLRRRSRACVRNQRKCDGVVNIFVIAPPPDEILLC